MASRDLRLKLHEKLCDILGSDHVYYRTPANFTMQYPCIKYERSKIDTIHADNISYLNWRRYKLTCIYEDPDSDLPDKVMEELPVQYETEYTSDNLNHTVFSLSL